MEQINNQENIALGIGPDLILQDYSNSSLEQDGNYLSMIKKHVNTKKIIFDIDYNWSIDIDMNIDRLFLERLKIHWREEDLKKYYMKIAINFLK